MKNLAKVIAALEIMNDVRFTMEHWYKRYSNITITDAIGTYIMTEDSGLRFAYDYDVSKGDSICLVSDPTVKDFNAVAIEFDITLGEALYLFSADAYDSGVSKRIVQDRIQALIKSKSVGVPKEQRPMGVIEGEKP